MIAIGPQAVQDSNFYYSLHQTKHEQSLCSLDSIQCSDFGSSDLAGTAWNLMRSSAIASSTEEIRRIRIPNSDFLLRELRM